MWFVRTREVLESWVALEGQGCASSCDAGLFARNNHSSNFYYLATHFQFLTCDPLIRRHEEYIDGEAAIANNCALQGVDTLSKQFGPSTNPPHPHWTRQNTTRSISFMHLDRKSLYISNATLEGPLRLCLYLLTFKID